MVGEEDRKLLRHKTWRDRCKLLQGNFGGDYWVEGSQREGGGFTAARVHEVDA
jgi:hypothetical protein